MANQFKQPVARSAGVAFCSLFGKNTNELNQTELLAFYRLKESLNLPYDQRAVQGLFRHLYETYFDEACPPQLFSSRWLTLGFQGERPESDLRAGGIMALQLTVRFVQKERAAVDSMAQPDNNFFFALASINLAYWLKMYLHLSDDKDSSWRRCGRSTLKKFSRMLVSNPLAFWQLHRLCLLHLYFRIWMKAKEEKGSINLSQFNAAFEELQQRIHRVFKREIYGWETFEIPWLYEK